MKNQYKNNILVQNRAVAAAACLPDSRFICNRATLRHNFVLSLRCRSQSLCAPASTKFIAVRFFDTSKGILPVLRSNCRARVCNYCSQKRRSRAGGVENINFCLLALRAACSFVFFDPSATPCAVFLLFCKFTNDLYMFA